MAQKLKSILHKSGIDRFWTRVLTKIQPLGHKKHPSRNHNRALGLQITTLVFVWDAAIIFILSHRPVRQVFGRLAFYFDKLAGALLGLMGAKLLHSAAQAQR